ncbi:MAG TPA: sugar transferase [Candidatus Baltobacteraceae bacterium]|nr:sugar transferase [Candidatus Baltobacteraceae bacterium]
MAAQVATLPAANAALVYRPNRTASRARRLMDVSVAAILLLFALPIIAAACLLTWLEDGSPALFSQRRAGRFERTFTLYKVRTMRKTECQDRRSPTHGADLRVTYVGRFLRKTSIDELPQLFNVLRGDMSLIGPRPEMPLVIGDYQRWQHLRHLVRPGITCIWQATCRSQIPLDRPEATALDIDYIRRASPALDGALLVQTLFSVVFQRGAY